MTNIIRPRSATIRLTRKRCRLRSRIDRPRASKTGSGERAEVATIGALGFDNHEVFVEALEGVDLDGFEEVGGRVGEDDGRGGAEGAGEVADGLGGAVDFAVVAGEEEPLQEVLVMGFGGKSVGERLDRTNHVLAVADDGLVDGTGAAAGD